MMDNDRAELERLAKKLDEAETRGQKLDWSAVAVRVLLRRAIKEDAKRAAQTQDESRNG